MVVTNIIPNKPSFLGTRKECDIKAICIFLATGFFLDQDTYYNGLTVAKPASEYDKDGQLLNTYFKWTYNPDCRPFDVIVDEFQALFESIIKDQVGDKNVILPLSGGLDSRTQAAALERINANVQSYSYEFDGGYKEASISEKIALAQGFPFSKFTIRKGYLWDVIDDLASINDCYSEFTHPRQMAFLDEYKEMGDVFSLGHWGDVLFDDMGVNDDLHFDEQVDVIIKKVIKKGGLELAAAVWVEWGLEGTFYDYFRARIEKLLKEINIVNSANAQIRAFKSLYWAPRWTSVNLSIFEKIAPITLPYYDNRICEFITTVPEKYLSGRKIQIEYLKRYSPQLAKIEWQENQPFNLFNYQWNKAPYNLPYRTISKLKRVIKPKKYIQRNWELQFIGDDNRKHLEKRLFSTSDLLSKNLREEFYQKFIEGDSVKYSHPVSMILTLMTWEEIQKNK